MTPVASETPKSYSIAVPNTADLSTHHASLLQEAEALLVVDQDSHALALDGFRRSAAAEKAVEALFKEPVDAAHKAHKFLTGLRTAVLGHPSRAKELFLKKADIYEAEARRKAEEEERKRQDEARKAEEERQIADAQQAEQEGDHATAEAILSEPVSVPTLHVAPAIAKVQGIVNQTRYGAEGYDLAALVCYLAGVKQLAHPEMLNQVAFSTVANNQLARAMKDNFKLPGVRLTKETTKQVRSA